MHTQSHTLRTALATNALFSLATGIPMIALTDPLAEFTALPPEPLPIVGVGLIGWALFVGGLASQRRPSTLLALGASLGDGAWVVATIVGLLGWGGALTAGGVAVIAAIGVVVGVLGLAQARGIRLAHMEPSDRWGTSWRVSITHAVDAPASRIWPVIADLAAISRFTDAVTTSEVDGPAQVGTNRTCRAPNGASWSESVTAIDPGRALELRFDADRPAFPFPASRMVGGWRIEEAPSGSLVEVWWSFVPKPRWAGTLLVPVIAWTLRRQFPPMIDRMAAAATQPESTEAA